MAEENKDKNTNNRPDFPDGSPKKRGPHTIILLILAIVMALVFWSQFKAFQSQGEQEVSYDTFMNAVDKGEVKDVEIRGTKIYYTPDVEGKSTENVRYYTVRTDDYELVNRLHEAGVKFKAIDEGTNEIIKEILSWVIMIGVFYIAMMLISRKISSGGGFMNVGKSTAKVYDMEKSTGITFKDVAGEEEAKESLAEMVDFLKNPGRYLEIGAKLPKGALLVGPPGTGKTLLAKAVAGEANVPFFSLSGSEFVEMYVGVGASRVRDLFKQANAKAPCIIFIDEIDAIGRSRDTRHTGGDSEREQTLNQLLSEMDGFDSSKGIIILAATNRPEVLDKALLRPGRFDRRVVVERPDLSGREQILRVHSKNVKMDESVDLHELAYATSGSVGADLANIINEAALTAVRKGRRFVSQQDLIESVEVVFAGKEKKDRIMSLEEKRIVAFHESGHALLTMLQKNTMPVQKITIVPRTMGSLGYVWQTPEEEKFLETKAEMEAHLVIAMGGRAAEALKFPSVTSGASNDIEQATNEARQMITRFGMSDKFGMVQLEGITGEYLDKRAVLQCSDETATKIDNEVRKTLKAAYDKAYKLLKKNEKTLDAIANFLVEHETITGKEFVEIYNQVTGQHIEVGAHQVKAIEQTVRESKSSKKQEEKISFEDALNQYGYHQDKEEEKSKFRVYASDEFFKKRDVLLKDEPDLSEGDQEEISKPEAVKPEEANAEHVNAEVEKIQEQKSEEAKFQETKSQETKSEIEKSDAADGKEVKAADENSQDEKAEAVTVDAEQVVDEMPWETYAKQNKSREDSEN